MILAALLLQTLPGPYFPGTPVSVVIPPSPPGAHEVRIRARVTWSAVQGYEAWGDPCTWAEVFAEPCGSWTLAQRTRASWRIHGASLASLAGARMERTSAFAGGLWPSDGAVDFGGTTGGLAQHAVTAEREAWVPLLETGATPGGSGVLRIVGRADTLAASTASVRLLFGWPAETGSVAHLFATTWSGTFDVLEYR